MATIDRHRSTESWTREMIPDVEIRRWKDSNVVRITAGINDEQVRARVPELSGYDGLEQLYGYVVVPGRESRPFQLGGDFWSNDTSSGHMDWQEGTVALGWDEINAGAQIALFYGTNKGPLHLQNAGDNWAINVISK